MADQCKAYVTQQLNGTYKSYAYYYSHVVGEGQNTQYVVHLCSSESVSVLNHADRVPFSRISSQGLLQNISKPLTVFLSVTKT